MKTALKTVVNGILANLTSDDEREVLDFWMWAVERDVANLYRKKQPIDRLIDGWTRVVKLYSEDKDFMKKYINN